METNKKQDPLSALDTRLKKARELVQDPLTKKTTDGSEKGSVLSLAFRVAVEIVSAVVIGFILGWFLDDWLGTKPWLMLTFVVIGFAAGVLNVYRMASGFGYSAGYANKKETVGSPNSANERK